MQPRLDLLLSGWAPYLGNNPALILDLSPRLSDAQRMEVEEIVSSIWGGVNMTWQWMTQGRGRIDRLSLWVGPVADSQPNRLVRLAKNGDISLLTGVKSSSIVEHYEVEIGNYLTIVDPSLVASGLTKSWRENAVNNIGSSAWLKLTGRRPIFISNDAISNQENVIDFVQVSGKIVGFASDVSLDSLKMLAECANEAGLTSLKLRCQIDPDLQPTLQSAIDQEMKILSSDLTACPGFLTEAGEGYVICRQA
jgi:hypothetical protein